MAVSDIAQKNHHELFPGHTSTLAVTDPELIEVFDNFAFDEVLSHGGLDPRQRLMVQLAALIAAQALSEYRALLSAALTIGVTPVEAKEIVYQAVPYVGMGKVFDVLHITNDVLTERGVSLPSKGRRRPHGRTGWRRAWASRSRSSATRPWRGCTSGPRPTSSTSSGSCRATASVTTSAAAVSTCAPANC
jgi:4-carboxymuconolactone decarboxylase